MICGIKLADKIAKLGNSEIWKWCAMPVNACP